MKAGIFLMSQDSILDKQQPTSCSYMKMPKTYRANCHCGLIKFTVTLDEALAPEGKGDIGHCNCSICTKNGTFIETMCSLVY